MAGGESPYQGLWFLKRKLLPLGEALTDFHRIPLGDRHEALYKPWCDLKKKPQDVAYVTVPQGAEHPHQFIRLARFYVLETRECRGGQGKMGNSSKEHGECCVTGLGEVGRETRDARREGRQVGGGMALGGGAEDAGFLTFNAAQWAAVPGAEAIRDEEPAVFIGLSPPWDRGPLARSS